MKTVLVIDDEDSIRQVLSIALKEKNYSVFTASNGAEGIEVFKSKKPNIVITDVKMHEMSGIEVTKKIKRMDEDVDVIIMTGYGSEELVIESMRAGASNFIKKPISLNELFTILENIIVKKESKKRSEVAKDIVVYEKKRCIIGNDITRIWNVVNQVLFNLPKNIESSVYEGLKIGLYEIIINAIEHGNLGITYEEKNQALNSNTYTELLDKRIREAEKENKKVIINSILNNGVFEVEVIDNGNGFDYTQLPSPHEPDRIFESNGRGIFLASVYYDDIRYIDPGNKVILTKRL